MKGHQDKHSRLLSAVGSALDNGISPEFSRIDFISHAACGVNDKHQCRDLFHTEQPVESNVDIL